MALPFSTTIESALNRIKPPTPDPSVELLINVPPREIELADRVMSAPSPAPRVSPSIVALVELMVSADKDT